VPDLPICRVLCLAALLASSGAVAQSGLKAPERDEPGLDPGLARAWFVPVYDRFGFASQSWRGGLGLAPARRFHWSYDLSERASLGMSYANAGQADPDPRALSLFGRYWLSSDWALSAESLSRDSGGLLRLLDFRIGVQRRF
jgi:hypothetical protein